jgi:hypothetical protein
MINTEIMKKIKSLLILGALLLVGFAGISQSITYRFNNMKIAPAAGPDTLIFDVEACSNVATTYTTAFTIKVNFDAAVFGTAAIPVVTEKLVLTQPTGYNILSTVISSGPSRFQQAFQANKTASPHNGTYQIAFLSNLTTAYQGVVRYKMLITGSGNCGIEFTTMTLGQNYVLTNGATTTINYTPVTLANNLLTLPSNPNVSLMLSEVGDPSNSSTNFVEIYNAGATSVDFTNHYAWYLNNFSGSSSVKLAGTLAAGAKYVIAVDNTDFVPNMTSAVVGTGGTTKYFLSTYGDYLTGTVTDVYDGSGTGIDFTGKHAVRHYNIVSPNATFTGAEWVVSAAQNIDMTPGSHHSTLTWDGVPDSEWRAKLNWAQGFIPDAGHNVSIPSAGAVPVISNGDNAYAHDLAITGSLIIQSDATLGDGSLITYGTVSGNASVQRYLGADRFWYVTQPVTSATANVFLHTWLYTYNEAASGWNTFISDETTPLTLMKGYADWTSSINPWHQGWSPVGDTTTSYVGVLNTGNISKALTKGGDGWNFVGNPYPSAVDWDASGWTKTNLASDGYAIWNGALLTNAQYIGGVGTNGASRYIHAAQGFFVQASSPGSIGVSNAVRVHNAQVFLKDEEVISNLLSLTVSNSTTSDETVIHFNEAATSELDYSFDARKLLAVASPQAYTLLGNDKMAINTFNNTNQTPVVTMGFNAPVAGDYTITASNIESFDASTPIYLEDLLTGDKISLREISSYAFTAGEGTSERFAVHFAEYQGIGDNTGSEVNSIYAVNNTVYVDFSGLRGEIAIYNILGQEVNHAVASNGMNKISIPQGNAVYIVKVISDNTTVTKKVFVK